MKVRTRIYAGFGLLVILGVSLTAFGVWQLGSIDTEVGKMQLVASNTRRVMETNHLIETMRRAWLRYRLDGDDASLAEEKQAQTKAMELMKAAENASILEERRRTYQGLQHQMETYAQAADRYFLATQTMMTERQKLFTSGDVLTVAVAKVVETAHAGHDAAVTNAANTVESAVLLVREANWRFLATQDPKGADTFKTNVEKANAAFAKLEPLASDAERPLIAEAKTALAAYEHGFEATSAAVLQSVDLYEKEMRPQMADMQKQLGSLSELMSKTFDDTQTAADNTIASTSLAQKGLAIVELVVGIGLAMLIGRGIVRPISAMTATMAKLAAGDKQVDIPARDNTDEIGEMARAVEVFKTSMIEADRLADERQAEQQRKEARQQLIDSHIQSFEASVGDIVRGVSSQATELQATAQSMSATAEETERQSTAVAAASEEASTNVQTVASAAEELSSSIAEISRQVATSSDITARAVEDTRRTNEQIQGLAEAAQSIGDVVKLISDIASQTNLLALNATIEAARAGDAGKGFAVVASEVKSLASQTAKATEEIGTKITEMQTATSHSVTAVQEIGQTIARINEIATTIASAVEEQGAATQEIARNVQQASAGTTEVSMNIVGVTRAANDTGAASTQVLGTAGELAQQSEALRNEVESFLRSIRAA
jgi:methyl-accepting chemotaxis protein